MVYCGCRYIRRTAVDVSTRFLPTTTRVWRVDFRSRASASVRTPSTTKQSSTDTSSPPPVGSQTTRCCITCSRFTSSTPESRGLTRGPIVVASIPSAFGLGTEPLPALSINPCRPVARTLRTRGHSLWTRGHHKVDVQKVYKNWNFRQYWRGGRPPSAPPRGYGPEPVHRREDLNENCNDTFNFLQGKAHLLNDCLTRSLLNYFYSAFEIQRALRYQRLSILYWRWRWVTLNHINYDNAQNSLLTAKSPRCRI